MVVSFLLGWRHVAGGRQPKCGTSCGLAWCSAFFRGHVTSPSQVRTPVRSESSSSLTDQVRLSLLIATHLCRIVPHLISLRLFHSQTGMLQQSIISIRRSTPHRKPRKGVFRAGSNRFDSQKGTYCRVLIIKIDRQEILLIKEELGEGRAHHTRQASPQKSRLDAPSSDAHYCCSRHK